MQDTKNLLLAWLSLMTCFTTAISTQTLLSITSAIILPVVLFLLGKFIDIAARVYLERRKHDR